eukprot:2188934-Karenia_brevis.AAC.1
MEMMMLKISPWGGGASGPAYICCPSKTRVAMATVSAASWSSCFSRSEAHKESAQHAKLRCA